jgi:serine phosphatase RsbU (regulator of sigma subunit)
MSTLLPQPRLKVLVADDDLIARKVVVGTLRARFEVCEASDGQEALERFKDFTPDLVLLDVEMPRMTGVEAARHMRALAGDRFVPILLISALEEQRTLVEGLANGADDFLPKPFNPRVFDSKLSVFLRIRDMQERLRAQNRDLARYHENTEAEHALAQELFERISQRSHLDEPGISVLQSPLAVFNGDAVLMDRTKRGELRWILADVAGHGLSGAIGTVPITSLFHAGTRHGLGPQELLGLLNYELKKMLPSRLFCAAAMLELNAARDELFIANAGLPAVLVRRRNGVVDVYPSTAPPLGIVERLQVAVVRVPVGEGDEVVMMSDGIAECRSPDGEMYGDARVLETIEAARDGAFDALLSSVALFTGGRQSDDLSLVTVRVMPPPPR